MRSAGETAGIAILATAGIALLMTASGCRGVRDVEPVEVDTLAAWMTGSFSNAAQVAGGTGQHDDVRLRCAPIWTDRADGRWSYVERATAADPARPYWQRIVCVHARGAQLVLDSYLLPGDTQRFAGAWRDARLLDDVAPASLTLRDGCGVHFTRAADGAFLGSTLDRECPSDLNGATWLSSTWTVTAQTITSWDRGFDDAGKQVWGATSGPYVFVREVASDDARAPR